MQFIDQPAFMALIKQTKLRPSLRKKLRYPEGLTLDDWNDRELFAISARNAPEGILLIATDVGLYATHYLLNTRMSDPKTGKSKSIICDFCCTWQSGGNAATITFPHPAKDGSISLLCCADIDCSAHTRIRTNAAILSKSQLPENITPEQRIARLNTRLTKLCETLELEPKVIQAVSK